MMYRYNEHRHKLDEDLMNDLREASVEAEAKVAASGRDVEPGSLDNVINGTPLDQVRAVIERKKRPAEIALRNHAIGQKMAGMVAERGRRIDAFFNTAKES